MAKRKPLNFDSEQLAKNLKESTGKGIDAFFSPPSPTPPEERGEDLIAKDRSPTPKLRAEKRRPPKTNERPKERTNERIKIRHSFDIFQDQLSKLQEIQIKTIQQGRKKPRLGDLAQQALDEFLKKNERSE